MPLGKRNRSSDLSGAEAERPSKRRAPAVPNHLSTLSDELLLRAFCHLPVRDLVTCMRVSRRFSRVGDDAQLWKQAYYDRFVQPRVSRLPGRPAEKGLQLFYSRRSRWLEDEELVRQGAKVDWKKQYKLRHNWSRGLCGRTRIRLEAEAEEPVGRATLVQTYGDVVYTASAETGLRAWSIKKDEQSLLATADWCVEEGGGVPMCLAVNSTKSEEVIVGFKNGSFGVYVLREDRFVCSYTHPPSGAGLLALAFADRHVLTLTEDHILSVYLFPETTLETPRVLSSLQSQTVWPPLSLSLRPSSTHVTASIAYAVPTYLSGWSVGLQEIRISHDGRIEMSRLTSAVKQGFTPLSDSISGTSSPSPSASPTPSRRTGLASLQSTARPTSLSYSHPYLLMSHPDNTLTFYLVTSTASELSLSPGNRLWGHTSSVAGVAVGSRGRAVSVSTRGEEIRVWELEGGFTSSASKRRLDSGEISVEVRRDTWNKKHHSQIDSDTLSSTATLIRHVPDVHVVPGWIEFDSERVLALKEETHGGRALMIYDFT